MRIFLVSGFALFLCAAQAAAQSWTPPADNQCCPSKWGTTDERGAGNHMKPETVLRAAKPIKAGQVFELAKQDPMLVGADNTAVEPLKIQGGTGSTVAPIAIR